MAAVSFPSTTFAPQSTKPNPKSVFPSPSNLSFSSRSCPSFPLTPLRCSPLRRAAITVACASADVSSSAKAFRGLCYVVGDNIDTDQIIPAEHLTLVPSNPSEYEKLGSFALCGLPSSYTTRFVVPDATKTEYSIIIGGANFGCGSSREHAPVALGAAGAVAVVAESYARIFFRNSVATGEVYPIEVEDRVCEECQTGDEVSVLLEEGGGRLINHRTGKEWKLKPIGDAGPVIEAGGIFAYARKTGMIPSAA
ncbi:hypothetical protein MLD38_006146 [Melastoma candidum]|uniref:Uncharacterized protein n=1 Tax=Melastoma candidum TaxID=119954 RepID=A0ACB9RR60_9MYRT|nr:hypothetical protein MLD38_006146 [Melastoma candidum]